MKIKTMKNEIFLAPAKLKLLLNEVSFKNLVKNDEMEMFGMLADNKILDKKSYNQALYFLLSNNLRNDGVGGMKIINGAKNIEFINFLGQEKFKEYFDMKLILKEVELCKYAPANIFCLFRKDINHPLLKSSLNDPTVKQDLIIFLLNFYIKNEDADEEQFMDLLKDKNTSTFIDTKAIKQMVGGFPNIPIKADFIKKVRCFLFGDEGEDNGIFFNSGEVMTSPYKTLTQKNFFVNDFMGSIFEKISKDPVLGQEMSKQKFVYAAGRIIEEWLEQNEEDISIKEGRYKLLIGFLENCMICQSTLSKEEIGLLKRIAKNSEVFAEDSKRIETNILKSAISKQMVIPKKTKAMNKI